MRIKINFDPIEPMGNYMPNKKIKKRNRTTAEVANIVDNEGLSYAIQYYCSGDDFVDPNLAALWKEAKTILDKIEVILQKTENELQ